MCDTFWKYKINIIYIYILNKWKSSYFPVHKNIIVLSANNNAPRDDILDNYSHLTVSKMTRSLSTLADNCAIDDVIEKPHDSTPFCEEEFPLELLNAACYIEQ